MSNEKKVMSQETFNLLQVQKHLSGNFRGAFVQGYIGDYIKRMEKWFRTNFPLKHQVKKNKKLKLK